VRNHTGIIIIIYFIIANEEVSFTVVLAVYEK